MALTLLVRFLADASELVDASAKASGGVKVLGKELDVGVIAKGAAVAGAVGIAVSAIADMTLAAAADRDAQAALATAMENSGANIDGWVEKVDGAIESGQALAFSDDDIRDSMATLTAATGDVDTADVAARDRAGYRARLGGRPRDRERRRRESERRAATARCASCYPASRKARPRRTRSPRRASVPPAPPTRTQSRLKGWANRGRSRSSELTETIGSVFLPILDAIIPALIPILTAFGTLVKAILPLLVPLIKALGAALGIVAKVLVAVVDAVVKVVSWFSKMISKVGELLSKLGPLKAAGDFIGGIIGGRSFAVGTQAAGAGTFALGPAGTSAQAGWSAVTINAYGDPQLIESAVVRALRRYDRTNGPAQLIPRWS